MIRYGATSLPEMSTAELVGQLSALAELERERHLAALLSLYTRAA